MKKRIIIAASLFIILSTVTSQQQIIISKFKIKEITIENISLIKEKDLKKLLVPIYGKNLLFLNNDEIKKELMQNNLIDSFNIKKKYPNTIKIEIFEKKPIAILIKEKKKFYISAEIDLIEFDNIKNFKDLPYVIGDEKKFKIFYENLEKINFPFYLVKKFTLYNSNRWNLETTDGKEVRLPSQNYIMSLKNFLDLNKNKNFEKYNIFDYRIDNQVILK